MRTALLVIDIQNGLVNFNPWKIDEVLTNVRMLQDCARQNNVEVIFVAHTTKDNDYMKLGSENWQVVEKVKPLEGEKLFAKYYSSSFKETELDVYLKEQGIERLIMTGMQTEKCLDTAVRVGFEFGYEVIVPEMTNTTFDTELIKAELIYKHHNFDIFNNRFASVVKVDEALMMIESEIK
jgi:nicotinamidase-related amidase